MIRKPWHCGHLPQQVNAVHGTDVNVLKFELFWPNFSRTSCISTGSVCFQIAVLGMSNVALEELCGPEVEEYLDFQISRVGDAHRQGWSWIKFYKQCNFLMSSRPQAFFSICNYNIYQSDQYSPLKIVTSSSFWKWPGFLNINYQSPLPGWVRRTTETHSGRCYAMPLTRWGIGKYWKDQLEIFIQK